MRLRYGYDRASNRLWREDLVAQSYSKDFDEIYAYDGLHRLRDMRRGRLNGTQTALTTQTFGQCWNLDATGNWTGFKETDNGSTWTLEQSRTANTVNEITAITNTTGTPWSQPRYDKAGNMTTLPGPAITGLDWTTLSTDEWSALTTDEWADLPASHTKDATYDAWNRLIKLTDGPTGHTIQENQYDARTFRTMRKDYEAGILSETRHFYYSLDWRCVEERVDSATDADRQFVWGLRCIDELICRDRDTDSDGDWDERLYACQDGSWSVAAVVDGSAVPVYRMSYSPYGIYQQHGGDFEPNELNSTWNIYFCGYQYDHQHESYLIRFRWYRPSHSWLSRDPALISISSQYHYCSSNPYFYNDPLGLYGFPLFPTAGLAGKAIGAIGAGIGAAIASPAIATAAIATAVVAAGTAGSIAAYNFSDKVLSPTVFGPTFGQVSPPIPGASTPRIEPDDSEKPKQGPGNPQDPQQKCGCDQGEFKKMQKCGSKPHGHDWQWAFNQRTAQGMVESLVIGIDPSRVGSTKGERVQKSCVDRNGKHGNGMHFNYYDNSGTLGATVVCCPCCYEDAQGNAKKGSQCYAPLKHKEKGEWELIQVVK